MLDMLFRHIFEFFQFFKKCLFPLSKITNHWFLNGQQREPAAYLQVCSTNLIIQLLTDYDQQFFSISRLIYWLPPSLQGHQSLASYTFYVYSATNSMSIKHRVSGRLAISVSCIVETEKTEGTEMLPTLLSWVPDFISGQVQGELQRTGICASVRSLGLDVSNTLECLLVIYCYKHSLRMSALFVISVGAPSRPS